MNTFDVFKIILMVQLFYSASITFLAYGMPSDQIMYVTAFSEPSSTIDLNSTTALVQESLERQTSLPIIELGALVFYSGNIILDLFLNFVYAVPQMLSLCIMGVMTLIGLDAQIVNIFQVFASAAVTIFYFLGLIQLITNVRSGRAI